MITANQPLILASTSHVRAQILRQAGFEFEIVNSKVDENKLKLTGAALPFSLLAVKLAAAKAKTVSSQHPENMVIGCDQIAVCENRVLNKTITLEGCKNQLQYLSGKAHHLFTAMVLYKNEDCILSHLSIPFLKMKALTVVEIEAYIQQDKPISSCGGYYYELNGHRLFDRIKGEREAICGLPLASIKKFLTAIRS